VTRVYLDIEAVEIAAEHRLDEPSVRAVRFLAEAGHEVVLVSGSPGEIAAELREAVADVVAAVPPRPETASWYLTADVERCQGTSARLHTVLIGAAPPAGSIHRCDAVARDVQAAALELLASEAMPGAAPAPEAGGVADPAEDADRAEDAGAT
jgi:hypothetical protein